MTVRPIFAPSSSVEDEHQYGGDEDDRKHYNTSNRGRRNWNQD
jgi:hypothetical protein